MKKEVLWEGIYSTVITKPNLVSLCSKFTGRALTTNRLIIEPEVIHFKVFKCKLLKHL